MADDGTLEFIVAGDGPTVLFIPGSYSTPAAWRPIQKALPPRWRMASIAILGYGGTAERRTADDPSIGHQVALVAEAARRLGGGPLHLVGHSYGATIALAAAISGVPVAGLALFEANPLHALQFDGTAHRLHAETLAMSLAFEAAVAAGEADAPRRIIDFWGAPGDWDALPEAVRVFCRRGAAANVLDWRGGFRFEAGPAQYAGVTVPVLLVRGGNAVPAMVAITDALARVLPDARPAVVDGAGHFLISTHPAECARQLAGFLAEVG